MKIFKKDDLMALKSQDPGEKMYRPEVLTKADGAENLGGLCGVIAAGAEVPYHYHDKRESVIIIVTGEAIETVEGKEYDLKEGDVVFLNAKEKHNIRNKSNTAEMRFIEFFTEPPLSKDFIAASK